LGWASSRAAPNTARDAIAIAMISDSYISRFTKLNWDWEALDKLKISTPVVKPRASRRKSPVKKTPIAPTTIDDDDAPIVVADDAKKSIAKILSVDAMPLDVQIRVWEGLADWATIERIQVSVAARAVRVPAPSANPPLLAPRIGRDSGPRRASRDRRRDPDAQARGPAGHARHHEQRDNSQPQARA
jgi:hypothetical protein